MLSFRFARRRSSILPFDFPFPRLSFARRSRVAINHKTHRDFKWDNPHRQRRKDWFAESGAGTWSRWRSTGPSATEYSVCRRKHMRWSGLIASSLSSFARWLLWLARVTAFAANSNLLIDYLGYFYPGIGAGAPRVVALIAIAVALTAVNVLGVRDAALFSDVFTIGKLIPIALFIGAGLFFLDPGNFSPPPAPAFSSFSQSTLLLVYAYTGFEMAIIPAGETRDPQRNLPFAILTSLALVAVVYILIQVVCVGTLPELAASKRPLADASERFLGVAGATVITVGVAISIIGNLVVVLLAAARLPFAMAGDHKLPRVFAATHERFRTPHVSIISTAVVMLALALSGTFTSIVAVSVVARLLAYIAICVALVVLRRRDEREMRFKAQFKAPAGVAVSIATLVLCAWLLANGYGSASEAMNAAAAAAVGLLIYGAYKLVRRKSDENIGSGEWGVGSGESNE